MAEASKKPKQVDLGTARSNFFFHTPLSVVVAATAAAAAPDLFLILFLHHVPDACSSGKLAKQRTLHFKKM